MDYVVAAANLYGQIYGIRGTIDAASVREVLKDVQVPSFSPSLTVKIHVTDEEAKESRETENDDTSEDFKSNPYVTTFQDFSSLRLSFNFLLHIRKRAARGTEKKVGFTVLENLGPADDSPQV